jgi:hypothetical protein
MSEERIHGDEGITYHGFIAQETQAVIDNHPEDEKWVRFN